MLQLQRVRINSDEKYSGRKGATRSKSSVPFTIFYFFVDNLAYSWIVCFDSTDSVKESHRFGGSSQLWIGVLEWSGLRRIRNFESENHRGGIVWDLGKSRSLG